MRTPAPEVTGVTCPGANLGRTKTGTFPYRDKGDGVKNNKCNELEMIHSSDSAQIVVIIDMANPTPLSYFEIGSAPPIEKENLVEFHLLYSGPLHSNGDRKEKHAIRKVFHFQLQQLWHLDLNLKLMAE